MKLRSPYAVNKRYRVEVTLNLHKRTFYRYGKNPQDVLNRTVSDVSKACNRAGKYAEISAKVFIA